MSERDIATTRPDASEIMQEIISHIPEYVESFEFNRSGRTRAAIRFTRPLKSSEAEA